MGFFRCSMGINFGADDATKKAGADACRKSSNCHGSQGRMTINGKSYIDQDIDNVNMAGIFGNCNFGGLMQCVQGIDQTQPVSAIRAASKACTVSSGCSANAIVPDETTEMAGMFGNCNIGKLFRCVGSINQSQSRYAVRTAAQTCKNSSGCVATAEQGSETEMFGGCNFSQYITCNSKLPAGQSWSASMAGVKACGVNAGCRQAAVAYPEIFPQTSLKAESEMKLVQKMYGEVSMVCDFFGLMDCNMALNKTGKTQAQIRAAKRACSTSTGCAPPAPRNANLSSKKYQCDDITMMNSIDDLVNEIATKGNNEIEAAEVKRQQTIATVSELFESPVVEL